MSSGAAQWVTHGPKEKFNRSLSPGSLDRLVDKKMASQKRETTNELEYEAVLLDIEGTTTPISFVKVDN